MSDANMLRLTAHKGIKTIQEKTSNINHQTSNLKGESSYLLFIFIYFKKYQHLQHLKPNKI